ncbi:MAG: type II toxin-antitoxin system VapC family toxin [Thermodesulfobacteriota bacterium]|nr:type II toxin-antitoxin system VapC family toxin [Thermodesulfobacteriota bacterium]
MNLLLDTHILLWWLNDDPLLSKKPRIAIADGKNLVFVSAASIWEIRIKEALKKLKIPSDFETILTRQPFESLSITAEHAHAVKGLPDYHRDPFDRMLVAQSKVEGFTLVTHDVHLKKYRIPILAA